MQKLKLKLAFGLIRIITSESVVVLTSVSTSRKTDTRLVTTRRFFLLPLFIFFCGVSLLKKLYYPGTTPVSSMPRVVEKTWHASPFHLNLLQMFSLPEIPFTFQSLTDLLSTNLEDLLPLWI